MHYPCDNYAKWGITISEVEQKLEKIFLHKRFHLHEIAENLWEEVIVSVNKTDDESDNTLLFSYYWYDCDLYFLEDGWGQYYITEIWVNHQ